MKNFRRLAIGAVATAAIAIGAFTLAPGLHAASNQDGGHMPMMQDGAAAMMQHHALSATGPVPTAPGQDAFGAIQEIVRILEVDPNTDWSKVDLEALRQHLIDMNDVTLNADAAAKPVDGGIEVAVTGSGRTAAAIQRMVPAHAREIEATHLNGWSAKTETLANGVLLRVTSTDPNEAQKIRGLGFIGIMVSGQHHQPHHLAMARGEMTEH